MPESGLTHLNVHAVRLTVHDLGDTHLRDLDATGQARTSGTSISLCLQPSDTLNLRITVQNRAFSDPFSTCLEQSVLFRMNTQTGR